MKKFTMFLALLMAVVFGYAQSTVYLTQGFNSMPPADWTISANASNWSSNSSANAGGTAPEARFRYTPQFNGESRLISPMIDLTGVTTLFLTFKHFVDHYQQPYTVGVATRDDGGPWNVVWSVNPTGNVGPAEVFIDINNGDQGSSAFQFCFFFSGNSNNIDYWYIDNVVLYEPCAVDGAMHQITTEPYAGQGNINVTGSFKNNGHQNITSAGVNYRINNGPVQTTNLTSLNVVPGGAQNFICTQPWTATPGVYTLKVWLSNVNAPSSDCDLENDTLTKTISIASQTTTRLPLFEEFTSSTCGPCATFNNNTFNPFVAANPGAFSLIKYQMSWPGAGDPYYTAEGGTRRSYYGVSAVPKLFVDGKASGMTTATMNNELAARIAKSTFFTIGIAPTYAGNVISIPVTITPYISGAFRVHVVIVEKTTTGNVATNGETSFKHVMMKMMPNGNGTNVNFVDGTPYTNTFTYTKGSSDNIEQMTDLQAIVFVQEHASKEVFQSAFSDISVAGIGDTDENAPAIYPNPAADYVIIANAENSILQLFDIYGKLMMTDAITETVHLLDVSSLSQGHYIIRMTSGDKSITKKISIIK